MWLMTGWQLVYLLLYKAQTKKSICNAYLKQAQKSILDKDGGGSTNEQPVISEY